MVNGVEKSNVTNPTGAQSINSNKGNVSNSGVGMVKLEGYDEFMKDFEVVGVHDLTPLCQVLDTYFFKFPIHFFTSILTSTPDFSIDY